MKQPAKTLGTAALGAAFAAAAAGTASAAPALPDATGLLGPVSQVAPVQEVAGKLPAGAPQALTGAASTLPGALQEATGDTLSSDNAAAPVTGLLGGLPAGELGGGLPGPLGG